MGLMVGHPAVVEEMVRGPSRFRPQLRRRDEVAIVSYRRTRVYLDRDASEMLPDDGVLLMRVCPTWRVHGSCRSAHCAKLPKGLGRDHRMRIHRNHEPAEFRTRTYRG
jgi:hypothetical protein